MAQCLEVCLPMWGTQVQSLLQEDPTCHRATKPITSTTEALVACSPSSTTEKGSHCNEKPLTAKKSSPHSPQLETASAAIIKQIKTKQTPRWTFRRCGGWSFLLWSHKGHLACFSSTCDSGSGCHKPLEPSQKVKSSVVSDSLRPHGW